MPEADGPPEDRPEPQSSIPRPPDDADQSLWDAYWERFRRQEVDDPVEDRREGYWDRFRRQQVDDPVDRRRRR